MQKKFQVNDKVFYVINDDEDINGIYISYVVTEDYARKYYNREGRTKPTVESITVKCLDENECYPVFTEDEIGSGIVGWMPENELLPYTDAAKILFQK
mgnify:CR=1 FL=1